jgi:predicted CopG family antitoxin
MATITIRDDHHEILSRRAAALGITLEELVAPYLKPAVAEAVARDPVALAELIRKRRAEREAAGLPVPSQEEVERRMAEFRAATNELHKLTAHLPPGHVIDDSRETIYGDR